VPRGTAPLPRLHAVTDDDVLARPDFIERARAALAAGGGRFALHLRGRRTTGARLYGLAALLCSEAREAGALLLANDRVDVARAANLDGVHLGRAGLPPVVARGLLPAGSWIGASVHDESGARAVAGDADYLVVGTVFASLTHPGRMGAGPELVARVQAATTIPVLAIGGITPERVAEVVAAGASGVAVLSGIWGAAEPGAAVRGYLRSLPEGAAAEMPRAGPGRVGKD
jgi:thiamine-phosphate pyrophosphorylase